MIRTAKARFSLYLLISCLVHLALGWLIKFPKLPTKSDLIEASIPVELSQVRSEVGNAPRGRGGVGRGWTGGKTKSPEDLSLSDLMVSDGTFPARGPHGEGTDLGLGSGTSPLLEEARGTVSFQLLYDRIDQVLDYPSEFISAGFEGLVKADVIFSPEGTFDRAHSHVEANSPYLRVHIARVLRRALQEGLPESWVRRTRGLNFKCVFQFELVGGSSVVVGTQDGLVVGKKLGFYRKGKELGAWSVGPLSGWGPAPVVGIDPEWILDQVRRPHTPDIDPLKKYRDDPDWRS